jgi:hypothetical protein
MLCTKLARLESINRRCGLLAHQRGASRESRRSKKQAEVMFRPVPSVGGIPDAAWERAQKLGRLMRIRRIMSIALAPAIAIRAVGKIIWATDRGWDSHRPEPAPENHRATFAQSLSTRAAQHASKNSSDCEGPGMLSHESGPISHARWSDRHRQAEVGQLADRDHVRHGNPACRRREAGRRRVAAER